MYVYISKYFPYTGKYFEPTILCALSCQFVYINVKYITAENVGGCTNINDRKTKPMKTFEYKLHINCIPIKIYENIADANNLICNTFSIFLSLSVVNL